MRAGLSVRLGARSVAAPSTFENTGSNEVSEGDNDGIGGGFTGDFHLDQHGVVTGWQEAFFRLEKFLNFFSFAPLP